MRQAENHFLEAGEWKSAVTMYREKGQWEDAHRVRVYNVCSGSREGLLCV